MWKPILRFPEVMLRPHWHSSSRSLLRKPDTLPYACFSLTFVIFFRFFLNSFCFFIWWIGYFVKLDKIANLL